MAFSRPTLQELITRVEADLVSRLEITGAILRRAMLRVLARVWAGATHGLHGHIEWASRQLFALTADAEQLDKFGAEMGLSRRAATFAEGSVTFTGTNTTVIPEGTRVARQDGVEYATTADGEIAAGTATIAIVAIEPGADPNADQGTTLSLVSPIAGIQSSATVAAGGIVDGIDAESDEGYRSRILARKRRPPQGGSVNDYENWTLEVAGITRVWVYENYMGLGTVGVTFVLDDQEDIIPDAPKVAEVQAYLDDPSRRPITAQVYVFAPIPVELDLEIAIAPNTEAVRAAVTAEIEDFLYREGSPNATLFISRIREAISIAAGEDNHELITPVADVEHALTEIPILGTITFSSL
jgi:uncharacterized phage protein gp47/JayE